jgi:Uma2 family endonuclease
MSTSIVRDREYASGMSNEPKKTGATYQDLVDLPPLYVAEIVAGDLYASPQPARRHVEISSVLGMLLGPPFQLGEGGPGGWKILDEPELHFGDDVLVPDLAAWRRERLPDTGIDDGWIELPPDWLCEILSPSTAKLDLQRKLPLYARVGVSFAWVIDPPEKTVKVLEASEGAWIQRATFSGNAVVRALPFDSIELDLGRVWPPDPSPVSS